MKVLEVTTDDCRKIAQLINMLHVSEYSANGKDICAAADSIRWLQSFAADVAKAYQSQTSSAASNSPVEAAVTPPSPGEFKIKNFSPGKGKK